MASAQHIRLEPFQSLVMNSKFVFQTLQENVIQTLCMKDVSMMTPRRLHSILSLPHLQSLTLTDIGPVDMDDGETLTRQTSSVEKISVDGKDVISLWNLGLHTSCPQVKILELNYQDEENVSSDIITMACSPFNHLTHIHVKGFVLFELSTTLNDPVSFCDAVKTSCPQLTNLSLTRFKLKNEKAAKIIQLMKTHPPLTNIE
ncbi:uncharacterized protein LOC115921423 [Strongylocentrotus purpuratus]|uniref:Uncharacterized protein n=1 Tax=Strongylocentrotus purpuratus TaxID=7668 RepID=A0A7M7NFD8_STRPU|nr:uncharacterized protein LOC115921423 [Strongylocentrotus purpuratus]